VRRYAPLIINAGGCEVKAHLRENTYFARLGGLELDVAAAEDLELIAKSVGGFNYEIDGRRYPHESWDPVHIKPAVPTRGYILFEEGANSLDFRYGIPVEIKSSPRDIWEWIDEMDK
jgi:hypothetical protein